MSATNTQSQPTGNSTLSSLAHRLSNYNDITDAALRVAAGAFLVPHGAQKLFGWFGGYGLDATGQFFQSQLGFANGYLAALGAGSVEFFGGIALAAGIMTRLSALAITVLLLVAATMHIANGFFWTNGGFEYPILWAIITFSYITKGGGRYSVDNTLKLPL